MAAIAPVPSGTASCIARARKRTSGTASAREIEPAATSAAYSPRLCPASSAGGGPPAAIHDRYTAMPAVSITGCGLTVRASSAARPVATSCQRSWPSARDASAKVAVTAASLANGVIMPTLCEP